MMKNVNIDNIKNFCIIGSGSSGKTSLAEAILFVSNVTTRLGSVDEGNTVCDYNEDEIERKISINASVVEFEYNNFKLNMIDTPGYVDFIGEVLSSIKISDAVVLVISGDSDIDTSTEQLFEIISENNKPVLVFINKLDKDNTDFIKTVQQIEQKLDVKLTPVLIPINTGKDFDSVINIITTKKIVGTGKEIKELELNESDESIKNYLEKLIDTVASCDDKLVEKFLEGEKIGEKELVDGLKTGFKQKKIIPVICGSAKKCVGIFALLNFITEYFPIPEITGKETDPFVGLVFKTTSEPGMGQMNFIRVYSGKLIAGNDVYNISKQSWERVGQICYVQGKKRIDINTLSAGDIGILIKLKQTRTNDILCDKKPDIDKIPNLELIKFPETVIDMAVSTKTKEEQEKLGNAMSSIILEDPTVKFGYNNETKEMVLSGMGNLQLEIIKNRIKTRFGIDVELVKPRIPYKETVKGTSRVQGKYKRQSGGRGQYGDCWIKIEPLERGKGFEFIDKIFGGAIPKNYIPSIEKGVLQAMSEGVISGYPVTDIRVTLDDGSYHEVDSSDMAFKIAGAMALRKGVSEANPCILEPIMNVEIIIPEEYLGSVMGDISGRRGKILGTEQGKGKKKQVVKALVPLAEMFQYGADLRSMTKGAGKFHISFSHYEELPSYLAQELIETYQKSKKTEE